jgi:primase-polymerase (primpol)-like protein
MVRTEPLAGKGQTRPHRLSKAEIESADDKPRTLPVNPDGIPSELKALTRWVCWSWLRRPDGKGRSKWTKPPIDPKTGRTASSTNPDTWSTFDAALACYGGGTVDGVGFVLGDGYAGVDLDDCHNAETGAVDPWASEIAASLDSYSEISPSRTGVKALLRGDVPFARKREGQVEMYSDGRYFTVTGHRLADSPITVNERQKALNRLNASLFAQDADVGSTATSSTATSTTAANGEPAAVDVAMITRLAATAGGKFALLWSGNTTDYTSPSEADLALCGLLARHIGPNPEAIDAAFRSSGLMRPKWSEKTIETPRSERPW